MDEETEIKELLADVVRNLVDKPDSVRVEEVLNRNLAVVLEVHVADSDVGKAIGMKGAYAEALRVLFGAMYGRIGKRLSLQVIDPRR